MENNMKFPTRFTAGGEQLTGCLVAHDKDQKPQVLFLHGAGAGTMQRQLPIAEYLLEKKGIASFLFDFSGHGESSGTLATSSLARRVSEAEAALQFFDVTSPFSLCGFSMGGHVALELLARYPVANLVLFYPGVYAAEAYSESFGEGFSEIIRQPNSWKDAAVVKNLHTFSGNFLLVIGEEDTVIPPGVIDMLDEAAQQAKKKEILKIPHASHLFLQAYLQNFETKMTLCEKIADYLT